MADTKSKIRNPKLISFPLVIDTLQTLFRIRKRIFLGDLNRFIDFVVDPCLQVFDAGIYDDAALGEEAFVSLDRIALFPEFEKLGRHIPGVIVSVQP